MHGTHPMPAPRRARQHLGGRMPRLLLALACGLLGSAMATAAQPSGSAWATLAERDPAAAAALPDDTRRLLQQLSWSQLQALLGGADPAAIVLDDGPTLATVLGTAPLLPWWTLDGGGGRSAAAGYQIEGTIGQPDAGRASGGGYALTGGFWFEGTTEPLPDAIFHDGFEAAGAGVIDAAGESRR
jgi:hypothetical protein